MDTISEYPCLSRMSFVSYIRLDVKFGHVYILAKVAHEMDMICDSKDTIKAFEDNWRKYARIILLNGKSIPFQTKELKILKVNLLQKIAMYISIMF